MLIHDLCAAFAPSILNTRLGCSDGRIITLTFRDTEVHVTESTPLPLTGPELATMTLRSCLRATSPTRTFYHGMISNLRGAGVTRPLHRRKAGLILRSLVASQSEQATCASHETHI